MTSPPERLPDKPLCLNCGWEFSEHDPKSGSCYNGGTGEDATGYEPRPPKHELWSAPLPEEPPAKCPTCTAPVVITKGYDNGLRGAEKIASSDTYRYADADRIASLESQLERLKAEQTTERAIHAFEVERLKAEQPATREDVQLLRDAANVFNPDISDVGDRLEDLADRLDVRLQRRLSQSEQTISGQSSKSGA